MEWEPAIAGQQTEAADGRVDWDGLRTAVMRRSAAQATGAAWRRQARGNRRAHRGP